MGKGGAGIIGVIIGLVAGIVVVALLGGGGNHRLLTTPFPVTISDVTSGACTIDPMPVTGLKSGVGDYVIWQQASKQPFTVTFPKGNVALNTGSPFENPLGSGWNTIFPSLNGTPYPTGQANRNLWEISTFTYDFYIQTITVNGTVCYDSSKNLNQNMKVHVK